MRNTKTQLMSTLAAVIKKYKKKYCVASQTKMIELLEKFYGVKIQVRQVNYHLADLRKWGLIKTIRRTHRNSDGTLCLETSATCLTPLGYYELWKLGSEWAKKMFDSLIKKYCPKITADIKKTPGPQDGEILRRLDLGKKMFQDPEFRAAFNVD